MRKTIRISDYFIYKIISVTYKTICCEYGLNTGGASLFLDFIDHALSEDASSKIRQKVLKKNEVKLRWSVWPQWIHGLCRLWRQTSPQRIP